MSAASTDKTLTFRPAESKVMPTYRRSALTFVRGEGARLFTEDGTAYLDFAAGIAVNNLGHCHPHIVRALSDQAGALWHVSNLYTIKDQERLADRLCALSFAERVFFANSGTEAIEGLIKLARKYHAAKGAPERSRILTIKGAFHGRTLAALSAAGNEAYLEGFEPRMEGFDHVPFGDHEALKAAVGPNTAAILVEPIQGEGGIRPLPDQCLQGLRALCDEHGILLLFDEVQTGFGRTGKLFAHEWSGIAPDAMAVAKGMGNGFPVGAVLASAEAASGMVAGTHGSTFGGNPLAMAVGNAVLDVMTQDGFLAHVMQCSEHLEQGLGGLLDRHGDMIETVRGRGLMWGLKLRRPPAELQEAARRRGLLTVGAGDNTLRLLPPLIVEAADISQALDALDAALSELKEHQ